MTYGELKDAVLDLAYGSLNDPTIDVGPTYEGLKNLAAELRGSVPVNPDVIEAEHGIGDWLSHFLAAIPPGYTVGIENRNPA